ncbi:hypothetical protein EDC52_101596 [Biostraticola tofi]|uniref:Uncharacterized protein n=1 Tax=Biostraticola tofi TaxID=466109 RepID=A0A4R3Z4L4_9GAMM|nr:hypothetical protein EDC52_101596 [Biostraticola tofi]
MVSTVVHKTAQGMGKVFLTVMDPVKRPHQRRQRQRQMGQQQGIHYALTADWDNPSNAVARDVDPLFTISAKISI